MPIEKTMAEQEVIKHTKKVFSIWGNREHSFWGKLKEFLIEIFIIVFAVSLSIWLHGRSEHSHQQAEAKDFLLGLREDLLSDMKEMEGDKKSYITQVNTFKYITSVRFGQKLNLDSLNKYKMWLFNFTQLQQNNGRFEGFKSSGKIGSIEDKELQNSIVDLYQENIPSVLLSTNFYVQIKHELRNFVIKNKKATSDSTSNLSQVLIMDEAQNLCLLLSDNGEILYRYDACINNIKIIVDKIEKIYEIKVVVD